MFWLGIIILSIYVIVGREVTLGSRKIRFLIDVSPNKETLLPTVSIVVAARNEERNIRVALQSLLQLDYHQLQLIIVNDRSEDRTGDILDEMKKGDPRLEILHLRDLPKGWLGKNHALWQGSLKATGELLLFTDADVVMEADTLTRAVSYFQAEQLDHLAATPEARMPSLFLNMFGVTFGFFFGIFTRPWKAPDPKSGCHIGIGAFNLVKAERYLQSGGHKTIALRPDDDLKLGKILKQNGCHQQLIYGAGLISVEWYTSIRELVLGLEKNVFAGTDYRLWFAISGVIFNLVAILWPFFALFFTSGSTLLLYALTVLTITLIAADGARFHGFSPWFALGFPFTAGLFTFIIIRSVTCNLVKGGITWRGTFYPLAELRKNQV
ncbi:MAG: glycosyltransferase [Deltaproteobacteria bacterium]|nr:MAG: glycosyltransferase [Deltaproteobacteria bacterium]